MKRGLVRGLSRSLVRGIVRDLPQGNTPVGFVQVKKPDASNVFKPDGSPIYAPKL